MTFVFHNINRLKLFLKPCWWFIGSTYNFITNYVGMGVIYRGIHKNHLTNEHPGVPTQVKFMYILSHITGVSYTWYASVAGLPNMYSMIDG